MHRHRHRPEPRSGVPQNGMKSVCRLGIRLRGKRDGTESMNSEKRKRERERQTGSEREGGLLELLHCPLPLLSCREKMLNPPCAESAAELGTMTFDSEERDEAFIS